MGAIGECRIDWGPGYRIYLMQDGDALIILLGGGTKKGQQRSTSRSTCCPSRAAPSLSWPSRPPAR